MRIKPDASVPLKIKAARLREREVRLREGEMAAGRESVPECETFQGCEATPGHGASLRERKTTPGRDLTLPEFPKPLPVEVIDNHTHLELVDGRHSLSPEQALEYAAQVGVTRIVQVGTDLRTSKWSAALAAADQRVLAAVAIHPNDAPDVAAAGDLERQLAELEALAKQPRVRAIGESGLDYFRTAPDGRAAQMQSFEAHIEMAKKHGIALQIHDREAHDDVVATLRRVQAPERTVFHCFSGGAPLAKICNDNGWYMSFSGTVTFKNAPNLRDALAVADKNLIMVETDAPFLTPVPYRGRPNSPYLMPYTVRAMADHLDMSVAELGAQLTANTLKVYGQW
ncbi:TatD family hydrolase [Canibacter zhuwentaonis]|uniref:TatD family hydrolase n=1 Tax=Canibacter zhuwentaonis TaxID=2837491 RepID=UPI002029691D|nr:TatD family hydrolase [Canibacter zhuwentaonis]